MRTRSDGRNQWWGGMHNTSKHPEFQLGTDNGMMRKHESPSLSLLSKPIQNVLQMLQSLFAMFRKINSQGLEECIWNYGCILGNVFAYPFYPCRWRQLEETVPVFSKYQMQGARCIRSGCHLLRDLVAGITHFEGLHTFAVRNTEDHTDL
jgi:hypothetical protein